jgi:tetratricopeptide (TPR) repeat protein
VIDAPAPELYDYVRDPGELRNRARGETQAVTELTKAARAVDRQFREPSAADAEEVRTLASIAAQVGAQKAKKPADPKNKVQVVRDLRRAARFFESRNYRDAIPLAERVAFSEPGIIDGWTLLGRSRSAAGQPSLALEAYREGLKRFPQSTDLSLLLSAEYARAGKWNEARNYAEAILPHDPVTAHEALAQIALRQGDDAAARRHADEAVRHAPGRIPTLMLLADLSRRAGRSAEQLMWLDRAEQEMSARALSPVETLSQQRGEALLAIGRIADAETALRTEVARFPRNRRAWTGLAALLIRQGRRDEARSILRDALMANDNAEMRALVRQTLEAAGDHEGLQALAPS